MDAKEMKPKIKRLDRAIQALGKCDTIDRAYLLDRFFTREEISAELLRRMQAERQHLAKLRKERTQ